MNYDMVIRNVSDIFDMYYWTFCLIIRKYQN